MSMAEVREVRYGNYDPTKPRLAEPDEINDVMALCRALHRENAQFPLNEEKVHQRMVQALSRKTGGIVGVIGDYRKIEAVMYLMLSQFWFTSEWHVEEIFSYVLPAHRKSEHAKNLIQWAKSTSDDLGMRLFIGVVSTIRTEAKVRLYRRQLGPPVGAYFIYGTNRHGGSSNGTEH